MICPCCGARGAQLLSFWDGLRAQAWKVIGLVAAVSGALVGQAELIGEPWHHYLSIAGIVATAFIAWNIKQHPTKEPIKESV